MHDYTLQMHVSSISRNEVLKQATTRHITLLQNVIKTAIEFIVCLLGVEELKQITYLEDFALRTLIKQQSLLVGGVQILLNYFGFLLGQTHSILQHIHLHICCCG